VVGEVQRGASSQCENPECGITDWHGKKISFEIHHINGIDNDSREENLQILCPNCHSQTDSFGGRKNRKNYTCSSCGSKRSKFSISGLCRKCSDEQSVKIDIRKVKERPSKDILFEQIKKLGYCGTGGLYGVSDNAVRKWIR